MSAFLSSTDVVRIVNEEICTENRHRVQFATLDCAKVVCADWKTGVLYQLDPARFADVGKPIARIRKLGHN